MVAHNSVLLQCYAALELSPGASLTEVREAFRTLCQIWHPDKQNPDSKEYELALRKQKELNQAFDILRKHLTSGTVTDEHARTLRKDTSAQPTDSTAVEDVPREILTKALNGCVQSQYELAKSLEKLGQLDEARGWYLKAARSSHVGSYFRLGLLHIGTEMRDFHQAAHWWKLGAQMEHPACLYNLGLLYEKGLGCPSDHMMAVSLYRKAAAKGDAQAKVKLEQMQKWFEAVVPKSDPAPASRSSADELAQLRCQTKPAHTADNTQNEKRSTETDRVRRFLHGQP